MQHNYSTTIAHFNFVQGFGFGAQLSELNLTLFFVKSTSSRTLVSQEGQLRAQSGLSVEAFMGNPP